MPSALSIAVSRTPCAPRADPLAQMAFGCEAADTDIAHRGLTPIDGSAAFETWTTTAPVRTGSHGVVAWRADDTLLFGHATVTLGDDIEDVTESLYHRILDCARSAGFAHLVRIWNFLPRINDGAGAGERYKRFCQGRARAFASYQRNPAHLPAGTAIGSRAGDDLLIYFMAAGTPARQIENPRQTSAFDYPREYGNPLFSRAVLWPHQGQTYLLVSGTASIVGHDSRHPEDIQAQLAQTWRNLETLRERAGAGTARVLRVYLRRREDEPPLRDFLARRLPADTPVLVLHADICRAELLVEVEAVYDVSAPRA